jgi:hypothetical protein
MRFLIPLLIAALLTLAFSLSSVGVARPAEPGLMPSLRAVGPLRVHCEHPGSLRLRRFEDRSARLECSGRILVRVSVPG